MIMATTTKRFAASSCAPPEGTTYLTIGQDLFSIEEYVLSQYNASLHESIQSKSKSKTNPLHSVYPAAFMVYTDLKELRGLSTPTDYGSGVEYAEGALNDLFAGYDVAMQLGLWLGGTKGCMKVNDGSWDGRIAQLIKYLSSASTQKIFLRLGYEFDNPWFYYDDPNEYVKAYHKIVDAIRSSPCKHKVEVVWHSWAAPTNFPLADFYPGDNYVDWVGVSIFQQLYPWAQRQDSTWAGGTLGDVEAVLEFAKLHHKPTMIAESSPYGGIDMESNETIAYGLQDPWDRWFQPVIDLIDKFDIGMWSYINCDWESQQMWQGVGFGESRIASNADVMKKWQQVVINGKKRKFLMAGSMKKCGSKWNRGDAIFGQTNALLPASIGQGTGVDLEDENNATKALVFVAVAFVALTISRMPRVFNNWRNPAYNKRKENRNALGNHETTPVLSHQAITCSHVKDEIHVAKAHTLDIYF